MILTGNNAERLHSLMRKDEYDLMRHGQIIFVGPFWNRESDSLCGSDWWDYLSPDKLTAIGSAPEGVFSFKATEYWQEYETAIDLTNYETLFESTFEIEKLGPLVVVRFISTEVLSQFSSSSTHPGYVEA